MYRANDVKIEIRTELILNEIKIQDKHFEKVIFKKARELGKVKRAPFKAKR